LRIASIREPRTAERLIQDLAAGGVRAVVEGQSVEGRYMVLIGPFSDYQSAENMAKVLKQRHLDAFPIRR
jgi:cell division protein FtsN